MMEYKRDSEEAPQVAASVQADAPKGAQQALYRRLEREGAEHNARVARKQEKQKATAIKGIFYIVIASLLAVYIPFIPGPITFIVVFFGLVAVDRMNE